MDSDVLISKFNFCSYFKSCTYLFNSLHIKFAVIRISYTRVMETAVERMTEL